MNIKLFMLFPVCKPMFGATETTIASDAEAAVFIPEVWANKALSMLRVATCMTQLVTRDYENAISAQGKVVHVQKRGVLVTNEKAANTSVTLQAPTATTIPVTLTNHKEVSFLVEDVAEAQANMPVLEGYVGDAAIVIAEDIDKALCSMYTEVLDTNDVKLNSSRALAASDILSARTKLVVNGKAPAQAPRYLVIRDMAEMLSVSTFINRDYVTPQAGGLPTETAWIGKVSGFTVFENQNVQQTRTNTSTHRLAFCPGALTLVTRRLPNPPANTGVQSSTIVEDGLAVRVLHGYNMNYLGLQVTIDILFGAAVLRSEWLCQICEFDDRSSS